VDRLLIGSPSQNYRASPHSTAVYQGSHSVTCHPTQVNVPRLTAAYPGVGGAAAKIEFGVLQRLKYDIWCQQI